jgi:isopenicillin-N N-acyltransferase like protein
MSLIPTVMLHGTPFERGRQHGARFQAEIAAGIAASISEQGAAAYNAARERAALAWPLVESSAPDVAAELRGLADGAQRDTSDLLLRSGFELFTTQDPVGCTAIAARGPRGALVAQNWDASPSFAPTLALFLHVSAEGFEQAIIGSFGHLGWVGCNRHGVAFVNNDLMLSSTRPGLPSQVIRRMILTERSVGAARDLLTALPHMGGRSYLLGDAGGAVAGIEVSAFHGARVNQVESPILHTNHALDPVIRSDESETSLTATYPSSRQRFARLRDRLPEALTVQAIAAVLSDREGLPNAIAKAVSPEEATATLFSVIFDCGARLIHLCTGAPSDNAYQQIAW